MCSTNIILHRDCDDMNRKWVIMKALVTIFTIIFCILLVYMIVDFGGDAKDILSMYKVVDGSKDEFPKQLQFMKEYIRVTGDISIALNTGLTPEEVEYIMGDEDSGWSPGGGSGGGSGGDDSSGGQSDPDLSNKNSADWAEYTHNGSKYIWEYQNAKWSDAKAYTGDTIKSAGCMWFALSCAKSNISGTAYGVEDALTACGYTVSRDSNGVWKVSPRLPCVGNDPNKKLANNSTYSTVPSIGSKIGLSIGNDTITVPTDADFTNYIYIVHASSDSRNLVSSGGQHWFVIVGTDSNGNYCLANIASGRSKTISKSDLAGTGLNHCYAIGR